MFANWSLLNVYISFLTANDLNYLVMISQKLKEFMITVKPRFNGQMRTNDSPLLEKVR